MHDPSPTIRQPTVPDLLPQRAAFVRHAAMQAHPSALRIPRILRPDLSFAAALAVLATPLLAIAQPGIPSSQPAKSTPASAASPFDSAPESGNDYASVRLIAEHTHLFPDRTNWIAMHFDIADGWHLYWKFAGDTGIPPAWRWTAPDGVTIGQPVWPAPTPYAPSDGSLDYIHERHLTLLFPVSITADAARRAAESNTPITLLAAIEWLVCKSVCLPGNAEATISVPVRPASVATAAPDPSSPATTVLFADARARTPLRDQITRHWGVTTEWLAPPSNAPANAGPILRITAANATAIRWYPDEQNLAFLPTNRAADTAARASAPATGTTTADPELRIPHRPSIARAPLVRGVLEIERGGSRVFLDLILPPPSPASSPTSPQRP